MTMQKALIVHTDRDRDIGLTSAAREQQLREGDAAMRHVGMGRQADLIAKCATQLKFVETGVNCQLVERHGFGEALVQQR